MATRPAPLTRPRPASKNASGEGGCSGPPAHPGTPTLPDWLTAVRPPPARKWQPAQGTRCRFVSPSRSRERPRALHTPEKFSRPPETAGIRPDQPWLRAESVGDPSSAAASVATRSELVLVVALSAVVSPWAFSFSDIGSTGGGGSVVGGSVVGGSVVGGSVVGVVSGGGS